MGIEQIPAECQLPPITECSYCGGKVEYVNNSVIYGGKSYGDHPFIYHCAGCGAFVGSHKGTSVPLGTLADHETREARKRAHSAFDHIWKNSRSITRKGAYQWLASKLGIKKHECHMAWFDKETCKKVVQFSLQRLRAESAQ